MVMPSFGSRVGVVFEGKEENLPCILEEHFLRQEKGEDSEAEGGEGKRGRLLIGSGGKFSVYREGSLFLALS